MRSLKNIDSPPGYILCTSPRSGSTLLCAMLKTAGAGAPSSLFFETQVGGWASRLGLTGAETDPASLRQIFAAARVRGAGGTATFGLRQQPRSFPALCQALEQAYPDKPDDLSRLVAAFGPLRFIYLSREDSVAQAVSLLRAQSSGLWHLGADGSEVERTAPQRDGGYDPKAIAETTARVDGDKAGWDAWFAATGLSPLRLGYETLAADPQACLARVLAYLDLPTAQAAQIATPLAKLADQETEDWIARYKADRHVSPL